MKCKFLTFLITHGNLASSLANVSEKLIMPTTKLYCYSNQRWSSEEIEKDIIQKIKEEQAEKVIIFVDLVGGSCWIIGNRIKHINPESAVIGGVNVPMLVSFFVNCNRLDWNELLEKIITDAQKGIVLR
ncbi:MAG: hypothetical protein GXO77_00095 [Calditrichaeota bacterium]|nr:hypothetical protein [Calditrichota bacterium]